MKKLESFEQKKAREIPVGGSFSIIPGHPLANDFHCFLYQCLLDDKLRTNGGVFDQILDTETIIVDFLSPAIVFYKVEC
ncbi:MAG: hypothetical protein HQM14_19635 [SAR324 cluster bacterium]|nr:hypothetical protein [SAR324 cluster bacterium]